MAVVDVQRPGVLEGEVALVAAVVEFDAEERRVRGPESRVRHLGCPRGACLTRGKRTAPEGRAPGLASHTTAALDTHGTRSSEKNTSRLWCVSYRFLLVVERKTPLVPASEAARLQRKVPGLPRSLDRGRDRVPLPPSRGRAPVCVAAQTVRE